MDLSPNLGLMRVSFEIGDRVGKWLVIGGPFPLSDRSKSTGYMVECDCGIRSGVSTYSLTARKSLGCMSCRWGSDCKIKDGRKVQIIIDGVEYTKHDLAKMFGLSLMTIRHRLMRGFDFEPSIRAGRFLGKRKGPSRSER